MAFSSDLKRDIPLSLSRRQRFQVYISRNYASLFILSFLPFTVVLFMWMAEIMFNQMLMLKWVFIKNAAALGLQFAIYYMYFAFICLCLSIIFFHKSSKLYRALSWHIILLAAHAWRNTLKDEITGAVTTFDKTAIYFPTSLGTIAIGMRERLIKGNPSVNRWSLTITYQQDIFLKETFTIPYWCLSLRLSTIENQKAEFTYGTFVTADGIIERTPNSSYRESVQNTDPMMTLKHQIENTPEIMALCRAIAHEYKKLSPAFDDSFLVIENAGIRIINNADIIHPWKKCSPQHDKVWLQLFTLHYQLLSALVNIINAKDVALDVSENELQLQQFSMPMKSSNLRLQSNNEFYFEATNQAITWQNALFHMKGTLKNSIPLKDDHQKVLTALFPIKFQSDSSLRIQLFSKHIFQRNGEFIFNTKNYSYQYSMMNEFTIKEANTNDYLIYVPLNYCVTHVETNLTAVHRLKFYYSPNLDENLVTLIVGIVSKNILRPEEIIREILLNKTLLGGVLALLLLCLGFIQS